MLTLVWAFCGQIDITNINRDSSKLKLKALYTQLREAGFSPEFVNVVEAMLEWEEAARPDFVELEAMLNTKIGEEAL